MSTSSASSSTSTAFPSQLSSSSKLPLLLGLASHASTAKTIVENALARTKAATILQTKLVIDRRRLSPSLRDTNKGTAIVATDTTSDDNQSKVKQSTSTGATTRTRENNTISSGASSIATSGVSSSQKKTKNVGKRDRSLLSRGDDDDAEQNDGLTESTPSMLGGGGIRPRKRVRVTTAVADNNTIALVNSNTTPATTSVTFRPSVTEHWLWTFLRSYSTDDRKAAARLLLVGIMTTPSSKNSNGNNEGKHSQQQLQLQKQGVITTSETTRSSWSWPDPHQTFVLVEQLVRMIRDHVVNDFYFCNNTSSTIAYSRDLCINKTKASLCSQGQLALELVGLLHYFLFPYKYKNKTSRFDNTTTNKTAEKLPSQSANKQQEDGKNETTRNVSKNDSSNENTAATTTTPAPALAPTTGTQSEIQNTVVPVHEVLSFARHWKWLTFSIWQLAVASAENESYNNHNEATNERHTVLAALVHLTYLLSIQAWEEAPTSTPEKPIEQTTSDNTSSITNNNEEGEKGETNTSSATPKQSLTSVMQALLAYNSKCLWGNMEIRYNDTSGRQVVFSPLACLIGAYFACSDGPVWNNKKLSSSRQSHVSSSSTSHTIKGRKSTEQCCRTLRALIDPATAPRTVRFYVPSRSTTTRGATKTPSSNAAGPTSDTKNNGMNDNAATATTASGSNTSAGRTTLGGSISTSATTTTGRRDIMQLSRYLLSSTNQSSASAAATAADPMENDDEVVLGSGVTSGSGAGGRMADEEEALTMVIGQDGEITTSARENRERYCLEELMEAAEEEDDDEDDDEDRHHRSAHRHLATAGEDEDEDDDDDEEEEDEEEEEEDEDNEDDYEHEDMETDDNHNANQNNEQTATAESQENANTGIDVGASQTEANNHHGSKNSCNDDDDVNVGDEDHDDDENNEEEVEEIVDEVDDDDEDAVMEEAEVVNVLEQQILEDAKAEAADVVAEDDAVVVEEVPAAGTGDDDGDGAHAEDEHEDQDLFDDVEEEDAESMDEDDDDVCDEVDGICPEDDEDEDAMDNSKFGSASAIGHEGVHMHLDELGATSRAVDSVSNSGNSTGPIEHSTTKGEVIPSIPDRKRLYVKASMQVLAAVYEVGASRKSFLSLSAENSLLQSVNEIVKPPKKPLNSKILLRRAPTQEEFFRGSLSRNPIAISSLKPSRNRSNVVNHGDAYDPTVADLRQHIANDLQMADSAELIEIIVANKILDVNLKLRVVLSVLWRNHLMENSSAGIPAFLAGSGATLLSTSSGLSVFLSTSSDGSIRRGGSGAGQTGTVSADTPISALPPIVATYRLAGVDGEATEDTVHVDDLVDPEMPSQSVSAEELERVLEAEYGVTHLVTAEKGVVCLLRSVQYSIADMLRRIRRDEIGNDGRNPAREHFKNCQPCEGLILLRHCAKLPSNRKKLLAARAPTLLLTMLLDVLKSLEATGNRSETSQSNPTAEFLQELIEVLTSDISVNQTESATSVSIDEALESDFTDDGEGMPLVLESIETIALSPPLRAVIAKLLPFLTYGKVDFSRELAGHFNRRIVVESLVDSAGEQQARTETETGPPKSVVLMNTFVQTAITLPATDVCNALRLELVNCGFVDKLMSFTLKDMPREPPSWSPALWSKGIDLGKNKDGNKWKDLEDGWRKYFLRDGIRTCLKILTGLCKKHGPTQKRIASNSKFLETCHWIEATSDNTSANVFTDGLGLLAETLLDEIRNDNGQVSALVDAVRRKTKLRKKELADERRKKALVTMSSFGRSSQAPAASKAASSVAASSVAASFLTPVLGLLRDPLKRKTSEPSSSNNKEEANSKPAWLAEAELIEDETGLTCAVCQEGRTLQPSELLGLYSFVKKVSIPNEQCGSRLSNDGTNLLKELPRTLPAYLDGNPAVEAWLLSGRAAGSDLSNTSSSSLSSSRRTNVYTTTVSAGNGIHISCHRKARQADRSHPKAAKSEWEGASLRNSRVSCNVILPLVSSRSSKVPLIAVDSALTDHQATISNLLGSTPKSMLWTVLHDVRLLLLRMAYREPLNSDCGGGSLLSNCQLIFYQLLMADMFDQDAQVDQPDQSQHARGLSAGFLAGCAIVSAKENDSSSVSLTRAVADAAPMAALTSVLFRNMVDDGLYDDALQDALENLGSVTKPHPKRRWLIGRDYFLRGLVICAGRRHALKVDGSGCTGSSLLSSRKRSSYAEWDAVDEAEGSRAARTSIRVRPITRRNQKPSIEEFQHALRPMVVLFALLDQLSTEFTINLSDVQIQEAAERIVRVIEDCHASHSIPDLLQKAKVLLGHDEIMQLLHKGMTSA